MIRLLGSSYRYAGEKLSKPEIIFVVDHHYNEDDRCFHIKQLLENSSCDPMEHLIVYDHVLQHDDELSNYNFISLPLLLAKEAHEFNSQDIDIDWSNKTKTFNFMINKPRMHRELLLLLIEYFKFDNYTYSLPWKTVDVNRASLARDTNNTKYKQIISDTELTIPNTNYVFGPEVEMDRGVRNGSFINSFTYKGLLQKTVFEPSCISLITEPVFYERETILTEKTIMSIYGGTIPVWVGGWRIADYMRDHGFDIFDDVVDHSYQNLTNPYDRCYEAVARNQHLLEDFNLAQQAIDFKRLEKNLNLVKQNQFLLDCQNQLKQLPKTVQQELGVKLF